MTQDIELPRQRRASACTTFGNFPKSTLSTELQFAAEAIDKGVIGSYPWNTVVDFQPQSKTLFHRMDTRFYAQELDDRQNILQAQSLTRQPGLIVIRNGSECPIPPTTKISRSETLETWKSIVQLPEECDLWHKCERLAPSLRALLICPTLRHLKYYHSIVHGSQGWSKHYPLGYMEPRDMLAYPSHQVRSVLLTTGLESWVVAHIDLEMANAFHAKTGLVPAANGGLVYGDTLINDTFWGNFRSIYVNYFQSLAKDKTAFMVGPYQLRRLQLNKYKYYVHCMYPGIVFATVPFWLECSELLDQLFYTGE